MREIRANLVLRIPPASRFAGSYRVVLVNRAADSLWLIALSNVIGKSLAYYRRPRRYSLREMEVLLGQSGAETGEGDVPAEWLLSDDQIQSRYERENASSKRCSQLSVRDRRWSILAPILSQYTTFALLEGGLYYRALEQRARELGVRVKIVASLLHLYWAGACIMNALLPRYYNSGARGRIRIQRKKLGAPDVAARNGVAHAADFIISQDDREKLSFGWETFLRPGQTVASAYLRTVEAFYRDGVSVVDGREVPILKAAHERPTIRQFRYWGTVHQLPGVLHCPVHHVALHGACLDCGCAQANVARTLSFNQPSKETREGVDSAQASQMLCVENEANTGRRCRQRRHRGNGNV
ncbi:hypothetical protein ACTJK6_15585 [Ralstonia sp. 22086]|uniref:hypothetical protein n=1 Tax=Ralstonia sp. 22086 TaxID=3453870 RepID=UPI003F873B55